MQLVIGSQNPGKILEFQSALQDLPLTLLSPLDLGIHESPEEHGETFAENARIKARFFFKRTNMPVAADDSGIFVEALKDELGVQTRRWGKGPDATDDEWISYFLERMEQEENRKASFVSTIVYIDTDGNEFLFEGRCEGEITVGLEADFPPGLPFQACFRPEGSEKVFSLLTPEEKKQISHRGRSLQKFEEYLQM